MCAYLTQYIDIVQVKQPVCIVYHQCFVFGEIDETAHLLLEAVAVVLDRLFCHHLAHVGTSGRVADHRRTASDQGDRLVACLLQTLHQAKCHEVSDMKAVRGRVEADVKRRLSVVYEIADLFFICYLCNQSSCNEFVVNLHDFCSFSL